MTKNILEIACFNLQSAIIAEKSGANRIELCVNYKDGGIFPSEKLIREVLANTQLPVFVMIRPRAGDFCYTAQEVESMKKQILLCKQLRCSGVVFGILTADKKVNMQTCKELVNLAKPLPCTFHRAFDEISDSISAIENIIECGFSRVLTSGGKNTAFEGKDAIAKLNEFAKNKIVLIPAGGIRSDNITEIARISNCFEFHSAAITDNSSFSDPQEIQSLSNYLSA